MNFSSLKPVTSLKGLSVLVAVSGGPDSMAVLHYLMKRDNVSIKAAVHFTHCDDFSREASNLVSDYCCSLNLALHKEESHNPYTSNKEHQWRNERYNFFHKVSSLYQNQLPIITAHNLDDALETYLMSFLKSGVKHTKIIPYKRDNPLVIRPFLTTKKESLKGYAESNNVPFLIDPCNSDPLLLRSRIRHQVKPLALTINPGLYKQVAGLYKNIQPLISPI